MPMADFEKGTKVCRKCKTEKEISQFSSYIKSQDGLFLWCKLCKSNSDKDYRKTHKEMLAIKAKEYQKEHKEERAEYYKKWREKNIKTCTEYAKQYYKINKRKISNKEKEKRKQKNIETPKEPSKCTANYKTGLKKCYACGEEKPLSEYYKSKTKKDGLAWECKDCSRRKSTEYRNDHIEKYRQASRIWGKMNCQARREYYKKCTHELRCFYLTGLLKQQGFDRKIITPELIDFKRAMITAKRELRKQKQLDC